MGRAGIAVEIVANADTLAYTCTLLNRPAGSTIEPMVMGVYVCAWMVVAPLMVLPLAVSAILIGRRWRLGILGVALGLTPIFAPTVVFRYIVAARHLVIDTGRP